MDCILLKTKLHLYGGMVVDLCSKSSAEIEEFINIDTLNTLNTLKTLFFCLVNSVPTSWKIENCS